MKPRIHPFPQDAQFRNAGMVRGRRMIRLTQPLLARTSRGDIVVPVHFLSDGASIPKPAQSIIGHPFDFYLEDAILHDWLYDPDSNPLGLTRRDADNLLRETFWNRRHPLWKQAAFYVAVRAGGARSFKTKSPSCA